MSEASTRGQVAEAKAESLLNSIQQRIHHQRDMLIGIQKVAAALQDRLLGEGPPSLEETADEPVPAGLLSQITKDLSINKGIIEGINETLDTITNAV